MADLEHDCVMLKRIRGDEVVGAFLGREALQKGADALPGCLYGSLGCVFGAGS